MKLTKTLGILAILATVQPAMAEETTITVPDGELHMIGDEGVAELPQKSKQKPQLSQVEAFLCP